MRFRILELRIIDSLENVFVAGPCFEMIAVSFTKGCLGNSHNAVFHVAQISCKMFAGVGGRKLHEFQRASVSIGPQRYSNESFRGSFCFAD